MVRGAEETRTVSSSIFVALAVVGGVGVLGKVSLLHGLPHRWRPAVLLIASLWILSSLLWKQAVRYRKVLAPLVLIGLFAGPVFLLPRAEKLHAEGRGTDQPSCIIAASDSMFHGRWPYDSARMWSHNPLSCGPGWVALQSPFVQVLGYRWTLVFELCLSVSTLIFCCGWSTASASLSLLALVPGLWITASDGSDFLPFGLLLAGVYALTVQSRRFSGPLAFVVGMIAQFRTATVLLPATLSRPMGAAASWAASILAIGMQAAFLFYNPERFTREGPMHIFAKLTDGHLSQTTPFHLGAAYTVAAVLGTAATHWVARRMRADRLLLGYLVAVFALPALLNLVTSFAHYGWTLSSLGYWEGGNWIVGCIPFSAYLLASSHDRSRAAVDEPITVPVTLSAMPERIHEPGLLPAFPSEGGERRRA